DARRVAMLLSDLDDEDYEVRRKATQELEKCGDVIEPALLKALAENPSPEKKRRIQKVLYKLCGATSAERLRQMRAIEVLERIGTMEAQQLLKTLADGAAEA